MELRLAAAEAKDSLMTEVFQQGKDLHTITATQIYGVAEDEVTKEQRQISQECELRIALWEWRKRAQELRRFDRNPDGS
jgi:hypothetical protein